MVSVPTALMYTSSMPHLLRCQASGSLADTTLNLQTISVSCVDHFFLKIDNIYIIQNFRVCVISPFNTTNHNKSLWFRQSCSRIELIPFIHIRIILFVYR
jgi:hypothetical protein